jgi:hypothetical protein
MLLRLREAYARLILLRWLSAPCELSGRADD